MTSVQALACTALGLPPIYFRRLLQSNAATTVLDFQPDSRAAGTPAVIIDRLNQACPRSAHYVLLWLYNQVSVFAPLHAPINIAVLHAVTRATIWSRASRRGTPGSSAVW